MKQGIQQNRKTLREHTCFRGTRKVHGMQKTQKILAALVVFKQEQPQSSFPIREVGYKDAGEGSSSGTAVIAQGGMGLN